MKYIKIVFLLFLNVTGYTQNGFIKTYDFGSPAVAFSNNLLLDNDTLVIGGVAINDTIPYLQAILFSKIDTNGNVVKKVLHLDSLEGNYTATTPPRSLIKLEDKKGYVLVGHILERGNGIIMKLDREGEQLWVKEYPDSNSLHDNYRRILEMDNGILVGGKKQTLDYSEDVFIMKIDYAGNKLWEKSYGGSDKRYILNDLIKVDNNEYVMGISTLANQGTPWQDWEYNSIIWAIDSLGNEKWKWESEPGLEEIEMRGLQQDNQGNWIYATKRGEHYAVNNSYQWTNTQAKFVVRDSNFNLIEERIYDEMDGPANEFLNLIDLSDGDWLGVGGDFVEDAIVYNHVLARMVRISSEQPGHFELGDSIWARSDRLFPDSVVSSGQWLHSAVELPSGSIIAAGYTTSIGQLGFLIKVNEHGCVDWNGCIPTNINPTETISFDLQLKVYPNPVRQQLYYQSEQIPIWDKVEILDMNGRVMRTTLSNNNILTAGLLPGVYILRLWKDGRLWTRKVVKY